MKRYQRSWYHLQFAVCVAFAIGFAIAGPRWLALVAVVALVLLILPYRSRSNP